MFSSLTCKINSPPTAPESYPIIASARIHPLDKYRSRRLCFLGITPYIQLLNYKTLNLNSSKSRLAGQWAPGICFHLPNTKACHHAWHFDACSGDQTQILLLARQAFSSPSHLPSSFFCTVLFLETGSCYVALASLELMAIYEVSTSQVLVYSMHYQVRLLVLHVCFLLSVPGNKILSKKKKYVSLIEILLSSSTWD